MPRTARASVGGICYHVINRGNVRPEVFRKDDDYAAFHRTLPRPASACRCGCSAYCLMPNHFHLVLWPREDGDLSRWMQWLMTSHVRRYHRHYRRQRPCVAGPVQGVPHSADEHLLTVLRYAERNPLRANLVDGLKTGAVVGLPRTLSREASETYFLYRFVAARWRTARG